VIGISKNIKGLIIIGIGLCSILTPIIFTLDTGEQGINDDDYNPNEEINDEEPKSIIDDDDTPPQDPELINGDDPDPQDPELINGDDPVLQDPAPLKDDGEPIKDDSGPTKDDDGPTKDDDGPTKDDDLPTKDDDPTPKEISAIIDFCPETLNLKSKGKWVTVYIELQEGYNVNDIVIVNILLDGLSQAESKPSEIGDYDEDEITDLMVKFDRQAVIEFFEEEETEVITITGELEDGTLFQGTCNIRVKNS
jgi:hypothetical protein